MCIFIYQYTFIVPCFGTICPDPPNFHRVHKKTTGPTPVEILGHLCPCFQFTRFPLGQIGAWRSFGAPGVDTPEEIGTTHLIYPVVDAAQLGAVAIFSNKSVTNEFMIFIACLRFWCRRALASVPCGRTLQKQTAQ